MKKNYKNLVFLFSMVLSVSSVVAQGVWKADSTTYISTAPLSASTLLTTGITGLSVMHSDQSGVISKGDKTATSVLYNGVTWDNLAMIQGSSNGMYYAFQPANNGQLEISLKMGSGKKTFVLELTPECPNNTDLATLTSGFATGDAIFGTPANFTLPNVFDTYSNGTATWNGTTAIQSTGSNVYMVLDFPVTANKTYVVGVLGSKLMLRGINYKVVAGINSISTEKEKLSFKNPAKNNLIINAKDNLQIGIYNAVGLLVKQQLLNPMSNQIDISDLSSGIYIIKDMNNIYASGKLIIE